MKIGSTCPFGHLSALVSGSFALTLDILPLKHGILGVSILWVEKDKCRTREQPKMPAKQGKTQQDHNWPHHIDRPQLDKNG